jgi:hypothetical protein
LLWKAFHFFLLSKGGAFQPYSGVILKGDFLMRRIPSLPISAVTMCLSISIISAQQPADFIGTDGRTRAGELLKMQNDILYIAVTENDSAKRVIVRHKSEFTKVIFTSGEYLDLALSNWPDVKGETAADSASQNGQLRPDSAKQVWADTRPTVAIADFDGRGGVAAGDAATLSDRFREKLIGTNAFRVMERNQMELILKEQGFQQTGACKDNECLVQIGQMIAVQKIISGIVGKVGGMYSVSIKMLSVESGAVEQNISEDCDCPVEELLTVTMERLAKRLAGVKVEETARKVEIKRGDASLYVKSDPDSARIYVDGKLVDGQTPLTLDNLTPGDHVIKTTKRELTGFATITLQANKMGRLDIRLVKQKTILKVASTPSEAEVYINGSPRTKAKPDQITPAIFENIAADSLLLTLFKVGYLDTTVGVRIATNEINNVSVALAEAPVEVVQFQKKLVGKKFRKKISFYFSLPGLACVAGGGISYYLAQKDFDAAAAAKSKLENSAIHSGPDYESLVKENKDKNDAAVLKRNLAYGISGAGAAMLGTGIMLRF